MGFRSTGARRVRYFLLMCLWAFSSSCNRWDARDFRIYRQKSIPKNLLVLLVPIVFVFGASFFFTLLEQMTLPLRQLRYAVIGLFVTLCCLPLIFALLSPRTVPVVYPPYYPPEIQQTARLDETG